MSIASEIERIQNAKSSIKTAIENKGVEVGEGTIDTYASKIDEITTGGGGDNWYDTFWDTFQQNGVLTNYVNAFSNKSWNNDIFYPKHDIKLEYADQIFYNAENLTVDLVERLNECNITFDTSNLKAATYLFRGCGVTRIPPISFVKTTHANLSYNFFNCFNLVTIEKIIVEARHTYNNCFISSTKLENITIEGEIGNAISFANSPLLATESVNSIINALVDLTGQTAQTLIFHATVKANLSDEQIASITSKNWTLA